MLFPFIIFLSFSFKSFDLITISSFIVSFLLSNIFIDSISKLFWNNLDLDKYSFYNPDIRFLYVFRILIFL